MIYILAFMLSLVALFAKPPRHIPEDRFDEYTSKGKIPVYDWYIDETVSTGHETVFKSATINLLIARALNRELGYYGLTDRYLYGMLDQYASVLKNKQVAVIGSNTPWYEAIVLAYGGHPVTIEYNRIINEDPRCQTMTPAEYDRNPILFDAILAISSIEHDGLGRYGDPLNPRGDLDVMQKMTSMLKKGGLLFLSIPVGNDALYWNAHRVYGFLRLPLLFKGWELVNSSGFTLDDLRVPGYTGHQPVFVLRPLIP